MTTDDDPHRLATAPIVVGVDSSPSCEPAIRWAARAAAGRGRALHLVHGLDLAVTRALPGRYGGMAPPVAESMREHGERILAAAERTARGAAEPSITTELSEDDPAGVLIARSATAHMVVLGALPGVGMLTRLGSTLLKVVTHGRGPVVVVKDTAEAANDSGPVVVGVDGSPVGEAALDAAFAEAAYRDAELVALHAWSDLDAGTFAGATYLEIPIADLEVAERALLAERLAGRQEEYPDVRITRQVFADGPRQHLAESSAAAQLIVVGSRGRGGFAGLLLGSTSIWIVQNARCPVMVVHPE